MLKFLLGAGTAAAILFSAFNVAAAEYGVTHNRFCKINAIVEITEKIMNEVNADAKARWEAALESKECVDMGLAQQVAIIEKASSVLTDPDGNVFVIVKVSEQGWYTWAIKGHNTNLPFGAGA